MTPEREPFAAAIRQYLKLGLAVMPIRERTKLPVGLWEQHAQERPTAAQWNEWWREYPACNVAVVYAASAAPDGAQLICMDTDSEAAETWVREQRPLPPTPTVKTHKGYHRYFYAPAGLEHSTASEHFPEVRAGVHYSLLPPSVHPSGTVYEWVDGLGFGEVLPTDLPPWGIALMQKPQARTQPEGDTGPVALSLPKGQRNDGLFRQCAKWRALYVPAAQLRASAHTLNATACVPPLSDSEVDTLVDSVLKYPEGTSTRQMMQARRVNGSPCAAGGPGRDATQEPEVYPAGVVEGVSQAVNEAAPQYEPPVAVVGGFRPAVEYAEQIITTTEDRRNLPRGIYGLRSGWPTMDAHFGGFRWQQLILLRAGTGIGKTTLMMHFAFATAEALMRIGSDAVLLVKQLEGGIEQWQWAWAGYKHGVPLWAFHPGGQDRATDEHHDGIMRAYAEWPVLPLEFSEERDGDKMLWEVERRVEAGPVEGVLLDNIQLLTYTGNPWAGQKRTAGRVMDFCKATGIPFLALSQVNEHKGMEDSTRGGPEFQHAASCVFSVKRGDNAMSREEALASNVTRITNHKLRNAPRGIMPELRLCMDLETKRLWEEAGDREGIGAHGEREEQRTWANN